MTKYELIADLLFWLCVCILGFSVYLVCVL